MSSVTQNAQEMTRTLPSLRLILSKELQERLPHDDCSLCHRPSFARRCARSLSAAAHSVSRWYAARRSSATAYRAHQSESASKTAELYSELVDRRVKR